MSYVEYDSNNSGGSWWLEDKDWDALERAGWRVKWIGLTEATRGNKKVMYKGAPKLVEDDPKRRFYFLYAGKVGKDGRKRWLGCIASRAYKPNCKSLREAAEDWEKVTGKSATDAGCPCCGQPHNFTLYDAKGNHIDSGPHTTYEASW